MSRNVSNLYNKRGTKTLGGGFLNLEMPYNYEYSYDAESVIDKTNIDLIKAAEDLQDVFERNRNILNAVPIKRDINIQKKKALRKSKVSRNVPITLKPLGSYSTLSPELGSINPVGGKIPIYTYENLLKIANTENLVYIIENVSKKLILETEWVERELNIILPEFPLQEQQPEFSDEQISELKVLRDQAKKNKEDELAALFEDIIFGTDFYEKIKQLEKINRDIALMKYVQTNINEDNYIGWMNYIKALTDATSVIKHNNLLLGYTELLKIQSDPDRDKKFQEFLNSDVFKNMNYLNDTQELKAKNKKSIQEIINDIQTHYAKAFDNFNRVTNFPDIINSVTRINKNEKQRLQSLKTSKTEIEQRKAKFDKKYKSILKQKEITNAYDLYDIFPPLIDFQMLKRDITIILEAYNNNMKLLYDNIIAPTTDGLVFTNSVISEKDLRSLYNNIYDLSLESIDVDVINRTKNEMDDIKKITAFDQNSHEFLRDLFKKKATDLILLLMIDAFNKMSIRDSSSEAYLKKIIDILKSLNDKKKQEFKKILETSNIIEDLRKSHNELEKLFSKIGTLTIEEPQRQTPKNDSENPKKIEIENVNEARLKLAIFNSNIDKLLSVTEADIFDKDVEKLINEKKIDDVKKAFQEKLKENWEAIMRYYNNENNEVSLIYKYIYYVNELYKNDKYNGYDSEKRVTFENIKNDYEMLKSEIDNFPMIDFIKAKKQSDEQIKVTISKLVDVGLELLKSKALREISEVSEIQNDDDAYKNKIGELTKTMNSFWDAYQTIKYNLLGGKESKMEKLFKDMDDIYTNNQNEDSLDDIAEKLKKLNVEDNFKDQNTSENTKTNIKKLLEKVGSILGTQKLLDKNVLNSQMQEIK